MNAETIVPLLYAIVAPTADPRDLRWQDAALCAEVDGEIFFPEKGGSVREPKAICRACPVRAECLEFALETGQGWGIWGGMSERERRRIKAERLKRATELGEAA